MKILTLPPGVVVFVQPLQRDLTPLRRPMVEDDEGLVLPLSSRVEDDEGCLVVLPFEVNVQTLDLHSLLLGDPVSPCGAIKNAPPKR